MLANSRGADASRSTPGSYQFSPGRLNAMPDRLGLFADIHADRRALELTLDRLEGLGVDEIVCAGDIVGYGDEPDAVVSILRERAVPCIRGNHDRWALERRQVIGPRGWRPAVFRDSTWEFLESLQECHRQVWAGRVVTVHHGSPHNDTEFVTPYKPIPTSVEGFWDENEGQILFLGHTHIPMIERTERGTLVNPGSILGVPGVQTSSSFAVIEAASLAIRFYDVASGREIRRDPVFLEDESLTEPVSC
jgi:putative phosphoesterase